MCVIKYNNTYKLLLIRYIKDLISILIKNNLICCFFSEISSNIYLTFFYLIVLNKSSIFTKNTLMQKQRISLKQATTIQKSVAPRQRISLNSVNSVNADIAEVEAVQKFDINVTERTFMIKFGTQQFGVVKHDNLSRFENLQRSCETKDQKSIASVLTIMKTYLKAGISFEKLKERLSKNDALFSPSIKVFINRINKV